MYQPETLLQIQNPVHHLGDVPRQTEKGSKLTVGAARAHRRVGRTYTSSWPDGMFEMANMLNAKYFEGSLLLNQEEFFCYFIPSRTIQVFCYSINRDTAILG